VKNAATLGMAQKKTAVFFDHFGLFGMEITYTLLARKFFEILCFVQFLYRQYAPQK
jgi:hypothetical protein